MDGTALGTNVLHDVLTVSMAGGSPMTLGAFVGGQFNFLSGPMNNNMAVYNCALTDHFLFSQRTSD